MRYELYSMEKLEKEKKRSKAWLIVILILTVMGLGACVTFCALTKTGNETTMELWTIGTSTAVGWLVIYLMDNGYLYHRRAYHHAELMLSEQRTDLWGTVEVNPRRQWVRNSVTVCTVILRNEAGERQLRIESEQAKGLAALKGQVHLQTAYGYVVAFGEEEA